MIGGGDNRVVGIKRTWINLEQALALKSCLAAIKPLHVRALVASDDEARLSLEALLIIRHQLSVALASFNLREESRAERARKRQQEGGEEHE